MWCTMWCFLFSFLHVGLLWVRFYNKYTLILSHFTICEVCRNMAVFHNSMQQGTTLKAGAVRRTSCIVDVCLLPSYTRAFSAITSSNDGPVYHLLASPPSVFRNPKIKQKSQDCTDSYQEKLQVTETPIKSAKFDLFGNTTGVEQSHVMTCSCFLRPSKIK